MVIKTTLPNEFNWTYWFLMKQFSDFSIQNQNKPIKCIPLDRFHLQTSSAIPLQKRSSTMLNSFNFSRILNVQGICFYLAYRENIENNNWLYLYSRRKSRETNSSVEISCYTKNLNAYVKYSSPSANWCAKIEFTMFTTLYIRS